MNTTFCFSVRADADVSVLPRVVEVFAVYGHVPQRLHVERNGPTHADLVIDAHLVDVTAAEAALVAKRLGRVVSVMQVLYSEKMRCAA